MNESKTPSGAAVPCISFPRHRRRTENHHHRHAMTHPDYRALCSAAIELWEADCDMGSVISDMRTALAQPEPVAPSDEELLRTYGAAKREYCYDGPIEDRILRAIRAATVHGLRAVLSHYGATPTPIPIAREEYHEDMGPVTWWVFPVVEPPYVGTPNDSDWPGYHTHFTPAPEVPADPDLPLPEVKS